MAENRALGELSNSPLTEINRGKNHLFAIGINAYVNFPKLTNAIKDIEDISETLVTQYSFDKDNVQVILDDQASRQNIIDSLDALRATVQPNDRLLIYYSGHGYSDQDRGFWIPVDAAPGHVSSFISNADTLEIIKFIRARHILLISDSCFSGSLLYRDVSAGISKKAIETWDRDPSRYAFISGKGVVSDGQPGENSPFAAGIIRHLQNNEEDVINIVRLADQVTQEISFNYPQQADISPLHGAGHKGGQYIFFKKGKEGIVISPEKAVEKPAENMSEPAKNSPLEKKIKKEDQPSEPSIVQNAKKIVNINTITGTVNF